MAEVDNAQQARQLTTLAIRPQEDSQATVVGAWLASLEDQWLAEGTYSVLRLPGQAASRRRVEAALSMGENGKPDVVAFYGHGQDAALGRRPSLNADGSVVLQQLLIDVTNCHLLDGMAVYTVACRSLRVLGRSVASAPTSRTTVYFGYDRSLWLPRSPEGRELVRDAVNRGANILHHRSLVPLAQQRYRTARRAVAYALVEANRTLRRMGPPFMLDALFVEDWKNGFGAIYQ